MLKYLLQDFSFRILDKGKPTVTWGRKATVPVRPGRPGCRRQERRAAEEIFEVSSPDFFVLRVKK